MSTIEAWEQNYQAGQHLSRWPWSEVVSLTFRHIKPLGKQTRVLELGCGAGANIPFFLGIEAEYWALEGSPTATARLQAAYPLLANNLHCADFTTTWPVQGRFNLILDRGSITHNPTQKIKAVLRQCKDKLCPGGQLICVDWFSSQHSSSQDGIEIDSHTRTDIKSGHLANTGPVNFADETLLKDLFNEVGLEILWLEHKINTISVPQDIGPRATRNLVARKPA